MMALPLSSSRSTTVEVDLTADAGEELGADRVGADLSGEIDLQGDVDGHHLVLLADDERVVDVLGGLKTEEWIVVDVVVELAGAQAEAGDDLAAVQRLAAAGDDAGLDQIDDAVGDHLGVDAEVLLVLRNESSAWGIRPMPTSIVEPSSTRAATYSAIWRVSSVASA